MMGVQGPDFCSINAGDTPPQPPYVFTYAGDYAISPVVEYGCIFSGTDIFDHLVFTSTSIGNLTVTDGSATPDMKGTIVENSFSVSEPLGSSGPGSTFYFIQLNGTFIDNNSWSGTFSITFDPNNNPFACENQTFQIQGTRI